MSEFKCKKCAYKTHRIDFILRHINGKKSCGIGTSGYDVVNIDIHCELCNKKFTTIKTLEFHIKNNCIYNKISNFNELKQLREEIKLLRQNNYTNINNNINTINNNNNNSNIQITVNSYDNTSLEKINDNIYNNILSNSEIYEIISKFIKVIHFNPEIQENHNIFIKNLSNRYISVLVDGQWELKNREIVIDYIIHEIETSINDWIEENGHEYPKAVEKFNDYKEIMLTNQHIINLSKEEVKLTLYNGRNLVNNLQ